MVDFIENKFSEIYVSIISLYYIWNKWYYNNFYNLYLPKLNWKAMTKKSISYDCHSQTTSLRYITRFIDQLYCVVSTSWLLRAMKIIVTIIWDRNTINNSSFSEVTSIWFRNMKWIAEVAQRHDHLDLHRFNATRI